MVKAYSASIVLSGETSFCRVILVIDETCDAVHRPFLSVGQRSDSFSGLVEGGQFGMACRDDIGAGFGIQIDAPVPVDCHVLYELEGVHESFVVLGQVGRHLER